MRDINKKLDSFEISFRITRGHVVITIPVGIRLKISRSIAIPLGFETQGKYYVIQNDGKISFSKLKITRDLIELENQCLFTAI